MSNVGSTVSRATTTSRHPRHPPKLQHVLKNEIKHGERQHDLIKKIPRIDEAMEAPDYDQTDYGETKVDTKRMQILQFLNIDKLLFFAPVCLHLL